LSNTKEDVGTQEDGRDKTEQTKKEEEHNQNW